MSAEVDTGGSADVGVGIDVGTVVVGGVGFFDGLDHAPNPDAVAPNDEARNVVVADLDTAGDLTLVSADVDGGFGNFDALDGLSNATLDFDTGVDALAPVGVVFEVTVVDGDIGSLTI
jgi:hypothetical protein